MLGRWVPIRVQNDFGQELLINAVLDTGFNDFLSLPRSVIKQLGLLAYNVLRVQLSDVSEATSPVYLARVVWHGSEQIIRIQGVEPSPLLGMALLLGSRVTLDVRYGVAVEIQPDRCAFAMNRQPNCLITY